MRSCAAAPSAAGLSLIGDAGKRRRARACRFRGILALTRVPTPGSAYAMTHTSDAAAELSEELSGGPLPSNPPYFDTSASGIDLLRQQRRRMLEEIRKLDEELRWERQQDRLRNLRRIGD
jgi:hypothetical protein